jgi:hypothetical protein
MRPHGHLRINGNKQRSWNARSATKADMNSRSCLLAPQLLALSACLRLLQYRSPLEGELQRLHAS